MDKQITNVSKGVFMNVTAKKKAAVMVSILIFSQSLLFGKGNSSVGMGTISPGNNPRALANPERGWYITMVTPVDINELSGFREKNITILLLEVNLGAFINGPLNDNKLGEIDFAFHAARGAGMSVIFRAAYDFDGQQNPEPADINTILGHIAQLKPILQKHEDILLNVQAGFLGPWGEWHSSKYGDGRWNPPLEEHQRTIANALLAAVPESVSIAFRRPVFIRNIAGRDEPLAETEAYGSSPIARIAFHNDALMSDETDMDTYSDSKFPRDSELGWINRQTLYTPMVAETNKVSRYNNVNNAVELLDRINILSLNYEYHPGVLKKWQKGKYNGVNAFTYIEMMMGYRFIINRAEISETTLPGADLRLNLEIINTGFGNLPKPKKYELALKKGDTIYRAKIDEDPRFWKKNEPVNREYYFSLPSDIDAGDWEVYLGLSSTFPSLENNPAYSICFANTEIWDKKLGLNKIGEITLKKAGDTGNTFRQITEKFM